MLDPDHDKCARKVSKRLLSLCVLVFPGLVTTHFASQFSPALHHSRHTVLRLATPRGAGGPGTLIAPDS